MNSGVRPPSHNVGYTGYNRVIELLRRMDQRRLIWLAAVAGLPYFVLALESIFISPQTWNAVFALFSKGHAIVFLIGIVIWEGIGIRVLVDTDSSIVRIMAFIVFVMPAVLVFSIPIYWFML